MKYLIPLFLFFLFLITPPVVLAQSEPYDITNFSSSITINQDSSITVEETIDVFFNEPRHGIYRELPEVYRYEDKVIDSKLEVLSVNEKYEVTRSFDNVSIKIGDPNREISGKKTYVIRYRVRNILQRFDAHDELYWNITGSGWSTTIDSAQAKVSSSFAQINKIQCFEGARLADMECGSKNSDNSSAEFSSETVLGNGRDMTIVVGLDKQNSINFSGSLRDKIRDYLPYTLPFLPFLTILYFWIKKGRDDRYIGDNVYYEPKNAKIESTPIFGKREFLPMVYSPINGLTPAEMGTLVDEKVDIQDVVAEMVELGRLGYLKIEKLPKKLFSQDYVIKKLKEADDKLRDYQKYLFDSIFSFANSKDEVKLSELKKKFYVKLTKFKEKLYSHVKEAGYFPESPDKVRGKWILLFMAVSFIAGFLLFKSVNYFDNFWLFAVFLAATGAGFILTFFMPKKTAKGYAFYRQATGLRFYLDKGKWREEIKEKQLFLDEILPLAISLGVVNKLARDMQELGVKEPSYFNAGGVAWASSLNSFSSSASSSLMTGASSSGWSGGSGFSGGSSGGGFGGGGGGSW